ncbi:hypothetical protein M0804_000250 [Polistes exclamans]|nr:hypothetical protein M0804_000250 [Polistes exclamans]
MLFQPRSDETTINNLKISLNVCKRATYKGIEAQLSKVGNVIPGYRNRVALGITQQAYFRVNFVEEKEGLYTSKKCGCFASHGFWERK